jgi:hypothetical protein
VLSPPTVALPHVTSDPSAVLAAKARPVAFSCRTWRSWADTMELSPPHLGSKLELVQKNTKKMPRLQIHPRFNCKILKHLIY